MSLCSILLTSAVCAPGRGADTDDFKRLLFEPHPFDPIAPLRRAAAQKITARMPLRTLPVSAAAPGAAPGPSDRRALTDRQAAGNRNLYLSFLLIGGIAAVDDIAIGNGNTLELRHDRDWVAGTGVALGLPWPKRYLPLRTELEYHYRYRMDLDVRDIDTPGRAGYKNNLSTHAVFLNTYYDLELGASWTLYAGGGIGWVRNVSDVTRTLIDTPGTSKRTDAKDNVGWNAALGVLWHFGAPAWSADFRYRYIDLGAVESGPHIDGAVVTGGNYTSHDFICGITYKF